MGAPGITATQGMLRTADHPWRLLLWMMGRVSVTLSWCCWVLTPPHANLGTALGWNRIQQSDHQCLCDSAGP